MIDYLSLNTNGVTARKTENYQKPRLCVVDFKALKSIHICKSNMMRNALFWKSLGVATTDLPLPAEIVAPIKKELGDDSPALKFIAFTLIQKSKYTHENEIQKYFEMIHEIKKFNLNLNEFKNAIKDFISKKDEQANPSGNNVCQNLRRKAKAYKSKKLLLHPRVGMILQRLDRRRPGSCKIIELNQNFGTVEWRHGKRRTRIATWNLRKPCLFKVLK